MLVATNQEWIEDQFSDCQLGDLRRTKRLIKVAKHMLEHPEGSIAQQNAEWPDAKAAYRLFDNGEVTFEPVCEPHWQATREQATGRCLIIGDTTELDRTKHKATEGLAPIGNGNGRGMHLHSGLMVQAEDGQLLGAAGALLHFRGRIPKNEPRAKRLRRRRESEIWGDLVEQVGPPSQKCQYVYVFDRGGDNFEAFCHLVENRSDWVVRANQMNRNVIGPDQQKQPLKEAVKNARYVGSYELKLRSRPGQSARVAKLDVSVVSVKFPVPQVVSAYVKSLSPEPIEMQVVCVQERDAPKGVKPLRWVLLTSLPVANLDDAWQVIDYYEQRWLVEEYHKVLKTGCNIEGHALRTVDRLKPLVGLISVVGTRLLRLKTLSRSEAKLPAKKHVPRAWLEVLAAYRPRLRGKSLTIRTFFRELARLGGFLARKSDGEPGWITIWRGYQKLYLLVTGYTAAKQSG